MRCLLSCLNLARLLDISISSCEAYQLLMQWRLLQQSLRILGLIGFSSNQKGSCQQGQPTAIVEVESTFVNICGVIAGLQVEVSDLGRRELQTCRH